MDGVACLHLKMRRLITGVLTFKYYFGHTAGDHVWKVLKRAQYLRVFSGQHEETIFLYFHH